MKGILPTWGIQAGAFPFVATNADRQNEAYFRFR